MVAGADVGWGAGAVRAGADRRGAGRVTLRRAVVVGAGGNVVVVVDSVVVVSSSVVVVDSVVVVALTRTAVKVGRSPPPKGQPARSIPRTAPAASTRITLDRARTKGGYAGRRHRARRLGRCCLGHDGVDVHRPAVTDRPDVAELERLGLYDPAAPGAEDRLLLLEKVFAMGATVDEVLEAARIASLGDLALDLSIRPPGETQDLEQYAAGSGLDPDLVRRMWRALGLPASGPVRVTPDAAAALRLLDAMSSWLTPETTFALARVVGSSSARVAEALISAFRVQIEVPHGTAGTAYSKVVDEYTEAARELLPLFLEAANAVFRRHMVLVSYQLWSTDDERAAVTHERAVGFADLVGSTEAVRAGSVAAMAAMVRQFEEQVWDLVTTAGGRVVKLIGDEAMFVIEDPVRACELALDLVDASPHPIRVGLAHGTVVALYGDYYGATVNLAARLVRTAEPSSVTVSGTVQRLAARAFAFEALAAQPLKGFPEPVSAYRLARTE
jgi:adenylate cyclase